MASPFDILQKMNQLRDGAGSVGPVDSYKPPTPEVSPLGSAYEAYKGTKGGAVPGAGGAIAAAVKGGDIDRIMATIRKLESGGNYTAKNPTSTASGAYQFLDSSWAGYGGYRRAADAPVAVQDAKARELIGQILSRNGGDVSTVPVSWYIGHVPTAGEWDKVPFGGNTATPRQYQQKWMEAYGGIY